LHFLDRPTNWTFFVSLIFAPVSCGVSEDVPGTSVSFAVLTELCCKITKSSAVAQMGDRGHDRHGPKGGGCCAPFAERLDPV